jgi:hypothetical protein
VIYLLRCLLRAGLDVAVWRPEDLHDGTIENQLDVLTGVWNGSAIQATCENCHRRVIADKGSRRFCSDRCRERARYLRKKAAKAAAPS